MTALIKIQKELPLELKTSQEQLNAMYRNLNQTKESFETVLKWVKIKVHPPPPQVILLCNSKIIYSKSSQLRSLQENQGKPSDKLNQLNVDEISIRSKEVPETIKNVVENSPKKLKEAKNLYDDRNMKKKAVQDAGSYCKFD